MDISQPDVGYPSEVVTLALLFVLKGRGQRAFWRWLNRDYQDLFPHLPDRSRLFRLFNSHRRWVELFMAEPLVLGVMDSYGVELIHPRREGRSPVQLGKRESPIPAGLSVQALFYPEPPWSGGRLRVDTANVHNGRAFQPLVEQFNERMVIFADAGFRKVGWQPYNLRLCQRGEWNGRMGVETVLSMLTTICQSKRMGHKNWVYLKSRLGYLMALFNILVQWHGFQPDETGFVPLPIAEFSL